MNKGLIGILALVGVGGAIAYAKSKDVATGSTVDGNVVQGDSGTTYAVKLVSTQDTDQGPVLTFQVSDSAGPILEYSQLQGHNDSRVLTVDPAAPNRQNDPMWAQAVADFGVLTSGLV